MTQEEIEIMIRSMEEHLEIAENANSLELSQAIEDTLALLEDLIPASAVDDY